MSFPEIELYGDMGPLFAALAKAQAEIRGALKDAVNPHFKSKYADLESTWQACRGPLAANGLAVIQSPFSEGGNIGVVTILGHASGAMISGRLVVAPMKFDAQGAGSTLTYLRRYALAAMVGVAPTDDDGEASVGRPVNGKGKDASEAWRATGMPAPPANEKVSEPVYDPVTGQVGPYSIALTPTPSGGTDYVAFGTRFIAGIKGAESMAELRAWKADNERQLKTCETAAKNVAKSIQGALALMEDQLLPAPDSEEPLPPNPPLGG